MPDDVVNATVDPSPAEPAATAAPVVAPAAAPAPAAPAAPIAAAPAAASTPAADPKPAEPKTEPEAPSFIALRETVTDPKLRNVVDRLNSLTDAAKAIVDLRTDNSKRIKVPDADATEEDKAKYRKALGVPDNPDGYKVVLPEGLQMTEADQAVLAAVLPIAHESGVPGEAFNGFVGKFMALSQQMQGEAIRQLEEFGKQAEVSLKREWGADFEANLNLANRTAERLGGPELKAFLNETPLATGGMLGDHPVMARLLAKIGRGSDEGDAWLGSTKEERTSFQQEIDRLNNEIPPGSAKYTTTAHQEKLRGLYEKLHGGAPIVGGAQRVA